MEEESGCKVGSKCQRATRSPLSIGPAKLLKNARTKKKYYKSSEKKEWDESSCPVCMEYPHNAVLLLCSSYDKGCRPYMCATSHRYSNCLEQYKKAYTKVTEIQCLQQQNGSTDNIESSADAPPLSEKMEVAELLCPLCRGQVKGWTVVERARKYFNSKKRTCMQDDCSFIGNFKLLRKHVKAKHPLARPRAVDPVLEEKWKTLEHERERNDAISTIMSSTPGAVVLGDYVIEPPSRSYYRDYNMDEILGDGFFSLESIDLGQNGAYRGRFRRYYDSFDEDDFGMGRPAPPGFQATSRSFHRILLGRTRRRRRHRDVNRGR